jgi:hypothetical protein
VLAPYFLLKICSLVEPCEHSEIIVADGDRHSACVSVCSSVHVRRIRDYGRGAHDWRRTRANHEVVDMLDKQTRGAILLLHRKGHSLRCISRLLFLSRDSVRKVVRLGSDQPPIIHRWSKLDALCERIVQMLTEFAGNVVKVHRALADAGTTVRYRTLTAFCRNNHLLEATAPVVRCCVRRPGAGSEGDTERFPGLAAQFNVRNIPNFALFSEGHLQFQQAGLVGASRMEGWIARAC